MCFDKIRVNPTGMRSCTNWKIITTVVFVLIEYKQFQELNFLVVIAFCVHKHSR